MRLVVVRNIAHPILSCHVTSRWRLYESTIRVAFRLGKLIRQSGCPVAYKTPKCIAIEAESETSCCFIKVSTYTLPFQTNDEAKSTTNIDISVRSLNSLRTDSKRKLLGRTGRMRGRALNRLVYGTSRAGTPANGEGYVGCEGGRSF